MLCKFPMLKQWQEEYYYRDFYNYGRLKAGYICCTVITLVTWSCCLGLEMKLHSDSLITESL